MIHIIAEGTLPQKNKNAFLELAKPLVEASQKESGNIIICINAMMIQKKLLL